MDTPVVLRGVDVATGLDAEAVVEEGREVTGADDEAEAVAAGLEEADVAAVEVVPAAVAGAADLGDEADVSFCCGLMSAVRLSSSDCRTTGSM